MVKVMASRVNSKEEYFLKTSVWSWQRQLQSKLAWCADGGGHDSGLITRDELQTRQRRGTNTPVKLAGKEPKARATLRSMSTEFTARGSCQANHYPYSIWVAEQDNTPANPPACPPTHISQQHMHCWGRRQLAQNACQPVKKKGACKKWYEASTTWSVCSEGWGVSLPPDLPRRVFTSTYSSSKLKYSQLLHREQLLLYPSIPSYPPWHFLLGDQFVSCLKQSFTSHILKLTSKFLILS